MSTPLRFTPAPESGAALSALARGVQGSVILKIAAEIRAMKARGEDVCNLTVGDFDPAYFPIPGALDEEIRKALSAGTDELPRLRRHPPAARGDLGLLPPRASARLPGRRHPRHGRGPPASLRRLQDASRSRRRGPLPGSVVEQRPLRPPLRCTGGGDSRPRLVELLPDGRAARPAPRQRPPPRPELARQPDRDRHRPGRAEEARRARPRREPPPRVARETPPLPALRPGLLDAHVRKRRSRDAGRPPAGPRAVHDPPRRHLEVVLRDGPEGRLGAHAARPPEPDGRHPRARRGLGSEARAGRDGRVPGPGGRDRSLPGRNEARASRSVSTSSTTASRR